MPELRKAALLQGIPLQLRRQTKRHALPITAPATNKPLVKFISLAYILESIQPLPPALTGVTEEVPIT